MIGTYDLADLVVWPRNRRFNQQLQPKRGFIRLLDDDPEFRDEIFVGFAAADRAIIRPHRWPAAKQLPSNDTRFVGVRKQPAESDDRECEDFRPLTEFVRSFASLKTQAMCLSPGGRFVGCFALLEHSRCAN